MKIIYIKLGIGINSYDHERLNIHLSTPDNIAIAIDYLNADEAIFKSLQVDEIIQISEYEFNQLPSSTVSPPISTNTNYLLTLNNFITGCPQDTDSFFLLRGAQFFKVLWGNLKTCLAGSVSAKFELVFRVGLISPGGGLPADGDSEFTLPALIGKKIRMELNGIPIYQLEPEDSDTIYYTFDDLTGQISRLILGDVNIFKAGDIVAIYEI